MKTSPLHRLLWLEAVISDRSCKPIDIAVGAIVMVRINNSSGLAWARMSTMASDLRVSEKTIQRGVRHLHNRKLLNVRQRKGTSNEYELVFPPDLVPSIKQRLDTLDRYPGPPRPVSAVSGVPLTQRKQNKEQSGQGMLAKEPAVSSHSGSRIARWMWGSRARLLGSPEQQSYEPELRRRLEEFGTDLARLPDNVVEHLLQRVKEGALMITDLLEARKLASDYEGA